MNKSVNERSSFGWLLDLVPADVLIVILRTAEVHRDLSIAEQTATSFAASILSLYDV